MNLRCAEIDELLAAYALDALTDAERVDVVTHLAECRAHDEELSGMRLVTGRLPLLVTEMAPPASLEAGLMRSFDAQVTAVESAGVELGRPRSFGAGLLGLLRRPVFAYGLAALLLVAGVGFGVAVSGNGNGLGGVEAVIREVEQANMQLRVVYLPDEEMAVLSFDLPSLSAGRTYQAWQITNGQPVSLGTMGSSGAAAFQSDLSNASAIAISVEPAGGSVAPTTTPVMVLEL